MDSSVKIFSGNASIALAAQIAKSFGKKSLGSLNIQKFSDGEIQPVFLESIRGDYVFLVQSTFSPSDNLMELLLMIDAVKRAVGLHDTPYFRDNVLSDPDLVVAFLALHRALDDGSPFEQRELLIGSFGELSRRHGASKARVETAPRDSAKIATVQKMAHERYAENLTLDELGEAVGLTPFQLIGLFKRATGLTPHAFLTQLRLKAAIGAMKSGAPLAEAALTAGFYDQSALTKHFKRCFGITPLQWVRADQH